MQVLITGAFGNLGAMCIDQALAMGFKVKCFDLKTPANLKAAKAYKGKVETVFGDISDSASLAPLLSNVDAIIHNASVLPPFTENKPKLAWKINVGGVENLIKAAQQHNPKLHFIFPSSVTVYGTPSQNETPRTISDPVTATDHYTQQKLACESLLKESGLAWTIMRVGVSVDARTLTTDWKTFKQLLNVTPNNPLEYVHPKDVARAMCRAVEHSDSIEKVLLIGGGESCQITQFQFLNAALHACGLSLNDNWLGKNTFYTHWMDTTESQSILQYQRYGFSYYQRELDYTLRFARLYLTPIRPLANWALKILIKRATCR